MNLKRLPLGKNNWDPAYRKKQIHSIVFLGILTAVLFMAVILSLWAGSYDTPLIQMIQGIFGIAEDEKINIVVQNVRLPRICTALVSGAGLGIAGCILQVILHNPLASASTLGVSQGAGFGAALAIIAFGAGTSKEGTVLIPACAFAGSMAVAFVILGLSKFRQVSAEAIILAGVAISSMFTGATTLLQYFADEIELAALVFWTFGDLGSASWSDIRLMAAVTLLCSVYYVLHRWDFNGLLSGTETAASLGINVRKLTMVNLILCCFLSSVIVSYIGLINFIGLIAPHIVRRAVGNNHVYLIPGSILAGSSLLLLGDLFARTVISPVILPIGAITSFLGGPLFLYLLFKGRKRE